MLVNPVSRKPESPIQVPEKQSAFPPRAQRNAFRHSDVPLALVVVSHGPIRCFRRNLMEQRLHRAQRCGEAATLGGRVYSIKHRLG